MAGYNSSEWPGKYAAVTREQLIMDWRSRITADPNVCHGKPCIKGTRTMVSVILDNLAAGESAEDIARDYELTQGDIQAAISYAAELAKNRVVSFSVDVA